MNSNDLWPRLKGCFCVLSHSSVDLHNSSACMDNNICYKTNYPWQLLWWGLWPCEEEECIHCFYCAFFISFLSGLGRVKILNNWVFFLFFFWWFILWNDFNLNVSFMIRCNIHRRTNPVLHTHITTLRNDINKILRELEFLPLCVLLQRRVFYFQAFTKHQQMSRPSAELDVNDRIYLKHFKYRSGYNF